VENTFEFPTKILALTSHQSQKINLKMKLQLNFRTIIFEMVFFIRLGLDHNGLVLGSSHFQEMTGQSKKTSLASKSGQKRLKKLYQYFKQGSVFLFGWTS